MSVETQGDFQTEKDLALVSEGVCRELMEHGLDSPGIGRDHRHLIPRLTGSNIVRIKMTGPADGETKMEGS